MNAHFENQHSTAERSETDCRKQPEGRGRPEKQFPVNLGGKKLTFYFPTVKEPPRVKVQGPAAVVGRRRVTIKDGNLVLSIGS